MKTATFILCLCIPLLAACADYPDVAVHSSSDNTGFTDRDYENRGGDPHNPGMGGEIGNHDQRNPAEHN